MWICSLSDRFEVIRWISSALGARFYAPAATMTPAGCKSQGARPAGIRGEKSGLVAQAAPARAK